MIGETFYSELVAAGCLLNGLAWGADGSLTFSENYPPKERERVKAVYAAHDATKLAPVAIVQSDAVTLATFLATLPNCPPDVAEIAARAPASVIEGITTTDANIKG